MRIARVAALGVLTAMVWSLSIETVWAGKPSGGGSAPSGTIWFRDRQLVDSTMNADGSGKTPVPVVLPLSEYEFTTHGGHRWFLHRQTVAGEFDPDGRGRQDYFAARDDGAMDVRLTTQADLDIVRGEGEASSHWTPDGLGLSWVAKRWSNGAAVDGGVYVAALALDADGNVAGLASQPAEPAFRTPIVSHQGEVVPDILSFSWAPDGTRFVYVARTFGTSAGARIGIVDLATGDDRYLVNGHSPAWSPDGGRVLYETFREWHVVAVDGTNDKALIKPNPWSTPHDACWSPTGSHIAYAWSSTKQDDAIYRIPSTGGGAVEIAAGGGWLFGWTE